MTRSGKRSAGLLPYRLMATHVEVFVVHMGGPFWVKKDAGAWSIVKGEYRDDEPPLEAARREFIEETGQQPPHGDLLELGEVRQSGGKSVTAWAVAGDIDPASVKSNTFMLEWPPRSGRTQEFPEIDRAAWFDTETVRTKLVQGQVPLIDALERHLGERL